MSGLYKTSHRSCGLRGKDTVLLLTSRERKEGSSLPELSIFSQKVSWIEGVGSLPLILIVEHRGQIGNNSDSLVVLKQTIIRKQRNVCVKHTSVYGD